MGKLDCKPLKFTGYSTQVSLRVALTSKRREVVWEGFRAYKGENSACEEAGEAVVSSEQRPISDSVHYAREQLRS